MKTRIKDQAAFKVSIFCDSKPNDKGYQRPFFTINKSFKDKNGTYKNTDFLDLQELHVLKSMLDRAILWASKLDQNPQEKQSNLPDELPSADELVKDIDKAFEDDDIPF